MASARKAITLLDKNQAKLLLRINQEIKKPVIISPPFQWAQGLNHIELEIKYSYRHDVPGCADLFNETVKITKDIFYVGASCECESNIYFELKFKFWDEVDVDTVKVKKIPVGKQLITVQKLTKPARWR
mmetsp:Transcript_18137/g.30988  ORF Transcript_18137/g.30988 Transcript_18137/m.30988 type:complete len:129 (+) Transcript_18137:431-817(+)